MKSKIAKKRIVVAVSGGISAYKSADLVSRLVNRGHEVRVVLSRSATEFVAPLTFSALTGYTARYEDDAMWHIELARFAELIVVAPATANRIAKLSAGVADDLLGAFCLASDAPRYFAPAMNVTMWSSVVVQENVSRLIASGWRQIGPEHGTMACGDFGYGRMSQVDEIITRMSVDSSLYTGKKILVTAGPTHQPIDEVRYIANRSSGKMGYAIARCASELGAEVSLVSGHTHLNIPFGVSVERVETCEQMYEATIERGKHVDYFFGAAAVADYSMKPAKGKKHKKAEGQKLTLELVQTKDIIATMTKFYPDIFTVGFCAETSHLTQSAKRKLKEKNMDMIVANLVGVNSDPDCGFDGDSNIATAYWQKGSEDFTKQSKESLAQNILKLVRKLDDGSTAKAR